MTCTHPPYRLALLAGLALAAAPLLCPAPAQAVPRQPTPPWPDFHLQRWSFDEALRQYPFNGAPSTIPEASLVESWSGYALQRGGDRVDPFAVPEVSDTVRLNFTADTGAIRLWFKPAWGNAATGGRGPGAYARLLELVNVSNGRSAPIVQWSLYATPDGSSLYVSGQSQAGPHDYLHTGLDWTADTWHLVLLTYTPTNSALYLDGDLAAIGDSLPFPTAPAAPALALILGSDITGASPAQGDFDELTTFARLPGAWDLAWYYPAHALRAAQGPVSEAELAALAARRQAALEARSSAISQILGRAENGMALQQLTQGVDCGTGTPPYLTNLVAGVVDGTNWTFGFAIAGGNAGDIYDILCGTNLLSTGPANVRWLTNGVPCGEYSFTAQPAAGAFYWLSLPGLGDTDGDGLPDWWETLHGLNPLVANSAGQDLDGDGLPDYEEYLYGSDPRSAPAWGLWVASPSAEGRLP